MKAMNFKMVMLSLIALVVGTTSLSAQNFFYDKKEVDGKVVESVRYELNDNGLYTKKLKNDFAYDAEGKLSEKVTYEWNSRKEEWIPKDRTNYAYDEVAGTMEIVLSTWNTKTGKYDETLEKATYQMDKDQQVVSVIITDKKGNIKSEVNGGVKTARLLTTAAR